MAITVLLAGVQDRDVSERRPVIALREHESVHSLSVGVALEHRVQASNTSTAGASNTLVMTISQSEGRLTVAEPWRLFMEVSL